MLKYLGVFIVIIQCAHGFQPLYARCNNRACYQTFSHPFGTYILYKCTVQQMAFEEESKKKKISLRELICLCGHTYSEHDNQRTNCVNLPV